MAFSPARRTALALPVLLAALGATTLGACNDDNLVCVASGCKPVVPPAVDDLVALGGQFCTASPNDINFPYKVLFVVDVSGSTTVSDALRQRGPAVAAAIAQYASNPEVYFAMMTFSDQAYADISTFTNDQATLAGGIPALNQSMGSTNYVSALSMAHDIILNDAQSLTPTDRARTSYDIQWISDGIPNPCSQVPAVPGDEQAILDLVKAQNLMSIKLSTIFLTGAGNAGCDVQNATGGTDSVGPGDLMQQMATEGGGTFQALAASQLKINIDITQELQPFENQLFYIVNESRVIKGGRALPDSDQDGIADEDEIANGTDPLSADPNNTGCSDMVNQTMSLNPNVCTVACAAAAIPAGATGPGASYADTDSDSLHDCEEAALGSSNSHADTDGDYLLDSLEVRFGTNYNNPATTTDDTDRDGVTDAEEIVTGTNPLVAEPNRFYAYSYAPLSNAASSTPGANCFNFSVSNVHLVETLATATTAAGDNVICLYSLELPQATSSSSAQPTVKRSCTTANLKTVAGSLQKTPADGSIQLDLSSFKPMTCASGPC